VEEEAANSEQEENRPQDVAERSQDGSGNEDKKDESDTDKKDESDTDKKDEDKKSDTEIKPKDDKKQGINFFQKRH